MFPECFLIRSLRLAKDSATRVETSRSAHWMGADHFLRDAVVFRLCLHGGNAPGTQNVQGNVQGTFREHSENIQGTFKKRSEAATSNRFCRGQEVRTREHPRRRWNSRHVQGTFGEHSGNIRGTCGEHLRNIQKPHLATATAADKKVRMFSCEAVNLLPAAPAIAILNPG